MGAKGSKHGHKPLLPRPCELCGKTFKPPHQWNRFCGRACGVRGRRGLSRLQPRPDVPCGYCGKSIPFTPQRRRNASAMNYCGVRCRSDHYVTRYRGHNNPNYKAAGWRLCVGCGARYHDYNKRRRFCGLDCTMTEAWSHGMANSTRGHMAERWVRDELEALGYAVTRSAASAGAYDLIALSATDIRLVSVKRTRRTRKSPSARSIAELRAGAGPTSPTVHKELWLWVDHEGWIVSRLTPDGYDRVDHPRRHIKKRAPIEVNDED